MKTWIKFIVSFMLGICLILVGITLGGLNVLTSGSGAIMNDFFFDIGVNKEKLPDINVQYDHQISDLTLEVHNAVVNIYEYNEQNIKMNIDNIYEGCEMKDNHDEIIFEQAEYIFGMNENYTAKIDIYVPEGFEFDNVHFTSSIGFLEVNDLRAKNVNIEGAGRIVINDLKASNVITDVGICAITFNDATIDYGLSVDVGFGAFTMTMLNQIESYNHIVDVGFGAVKINDKSYVGISSKSNENDYNNKYIEVDCGFSAVKIEGGQ